ncbi:Zinc metalloprotease Rip1 [Pseudoclavibacter triregionum]|nr:Zinc metalloprotease Rip1 [Pseudoclavibacter triregionum]
MESVLLFIVGVVVALLGIAISIALHEIGHLVPAKRFGVRVSQYMIGFGPTIWSRKKGETEYGLKLLPLGGYVALSGMYPPKHRGEAPRDGGTGFISGMIEDARNANAETIHPGEEHRAFSLLPAWKRIIVMLGGPVMNLLIAVVCFLIVGSGFGIYQPTTTLASVSQCVVSAQEAAQLAPGEEPQCTTVAPGAAAGLQPGDEIVSMNGQPISSWDEAKAVIRVSANTPIETVIRRGGVEQTVTITPQPNIVYVIDSFSGERVRGEDGQYLTEEVGFVGVSPTSARQHMPPSFAFEFAGYNIRKVGEMILSLPQRVVDMWNAGFGGAERDPNGPQSVVGVGRVIGEVSAQTSIPLVDRIATVIQIVGSLNIALGIMNLIPLPPLDGGHIAAAIIDSIRRGLARLLGKPDPGPFDTAKLLPVTMTVAALLFAMSMLFIYVDIVNPVSIFGSTSP